MTKGKWCGNIDEFASEPPGSRRMKYVFKRRVSKLSILNLKRKPREIDRNGDEVLKLATVRQNSMRRKEFAVS